MASVVFELVGEVATRKAGKVLGELLRQEPIGTRAFVLALEGELGAGKTTFVRGLAKGLGIRENITSPSFLIAKCYRIPVNRSISQSANRLADHRRARNRLTDSPTNRFTDFWHFDFYRFHRSVSKRDLALLDFEEILGDPHTIVAVEWAERVRQFLPKSKFTLRFEVMDQRQRRLVIVGRS